MNLKPAVIFGLLSVVGCSSLPYMGTPGAVATTTLKPTAGNIAAGTVTFTQEGNKVRAEGTITGLSPGPHGIHVHEKGDCTAADGSSAGGHFNPGGKSHGSHNSAARHGGDLGNIIADDYGVAKVDVSVEGISTTTGAADSVVGRALIVHLDTDDFTTQPTGNSGKRVACGVIAAK